MPDERAVIDRVGRYWDAVVRGDESAAIDVDPGLTAAIHRVHELGAIPPSSAQERVWRKVLANAGDPHREKGKPMLHVIAPGQLPSSMPGAGLTGRAGMTGHRHRWLAAQFATAALLVVTLIGSFFAFGPGRFNRQEESPAFIPAIAGTPATPDAAETAPVAEFLWKSDGGPDLSFSEPNHPAIDPEGNIWVPDGWNSRFVIYAPDGTLLETWGTEGSGDGEFLFENGGIGFGGVAFDAAGNIYVADSGNHRVQKFGPDRTFLAAWGTEGTGDGQLRSPVALAVDAQGRVFVSDRSRGSIEVFATDGAWLASWGGMSSPVGIAVDGDGNMWVADEGMSQVLQFSPIGKRLARWNDYGAADGQLMSPAGVAVDVQGRIYVSDRGDRVQVFSPDGDFIAAWDGSETDAGRFNGPYGVTIDDHGNAYVAEDYGKSLKAFRLLPPLAATGATESERPPAALSSGAEFLWESRGAADMPLGNGGMMTLDSEGNLWIADGERHQFQIFAPDGTFLESWGGAGTGDGQFDFEEDGFTVGAAAFDSAGNLYVADTGNHRIQKFGPDRSFLHAWGSEGRDEGQFMYAASLAVGPDDRIYVLDNDQNELQVFASDGAYLEKIGEHGFGDGQLYLFGSGAVTLDAAGNIWITDGSNQRIQQFSPEGEFLAAWGEYGDGAGQFKLPGGVAVDRNGRVYVADWGNRRVQAFAPDGTFLAAWGTAGDGPGQFLSPLGLALDAAGNIYVSDEVSNRIQKFRLLPPLAP